VLSSFQSQHVRTRRQQQAQTVVQNTIEPFPLEMLKTAATSTRTGNVRVDSSQTRCTDT
jgi:hypothetical protein